MSDITEIPLEELRQDYSASKLDSATCEKILPLLEGEVHGRFKDRIEGNTKIMKAIEEELKRRGVQI